MVSGTIPPARPGRLPAAPRRAATAVALVALVMVMLSAAAAHGRAPDRYEPTRQSLERHPLPAWWDNAKFGVFIHWGPYSVPAFSSRAGLEVLSEWYWLGMQLPVGEISAHHLSRYGAEFPYDGFIPDFTAERFDADRWVRLFKRAGARYFVLTAKHHDGFALWPTRTTGRDSAELGPGRDLVGELFAAARRSGSSVRPGLYYSIPEWFNPAPFAGSREGPSALFPQSAPRNPFTGAPVPYTGYRPIADYAAGQVRPQLRELIDDYHPYVLWCDIGGEEPYYRSNATIARYYNRARRTNPEGVVVNDRCGDDRTHRDYATVEVSGSRNDERTAGRSETVQTMGFSWGFDRRDLERPSLAGKGRLVDTLVTAVSEDSNLLLNIGPRPDGSIPGQMRDRLLAIGRWLRINGEAIYGTRPWRRRSAAGDVRFTVRDRGPNRPRAFYMTALDWPGGRLVTDADVPVVRGGHRARIKLLGSDRRRLGYRVDGSRLIVRTPDADPTAATRARHAYAFRITRARGR